MKKTILIFTLSTFIFVACKQTKQDTVEDLISVSNKFDKNKVGEFLSDNFIYSDKKEKRLNKTEYLTRLDSLKNIEYMTEIISSQNSDSVVKTEENVSTIFDSLMTGTSKIVQKKTYRFVDEKLKSITVDTTLNYDKYNATLNEKISPILYYARVQNDIQDEAEIYKNIKKIINEFGCLSQSDKNKYKKYSRVQGTYIGRGLFNKFIFKKEHCNFEYLGIGMSGRYAIEDDFVYIESAFGTLGNISLKIIDNNTLEGEGWATGIFIKSK